MTMEMTQYLLYFMCLTVKLVQSATRPNIVLIIADDLGWNDVSFHGTDQIYTPNIDVLAHSGVILNQYRTHCQCTPSRAALLTGKFAHNTGMQGYPLTNAEDRGLPLSEKILPQYLKELDYSTHLVGKWHLGRSRSSFLPTNRGFDTHFGNLGGFLDYYEYTAAEKWVSGQESGFDLYRNMTPAWDVEGYLTDVYTAEAKKIIMAHDTSKPLFIQLAHTAPHAANDGALLQAPPEVVRSMHHIESPERRIYAAMVKKLDDSIGEVIRTLSDKNILMNTIIVFMSDNGGMSTGISMNWGSNWPLRGLKMSPWDGGIRVISAIWSATLAGSKNIWNGNMHTVDLLPTILKAVDGDVPDGIDGLDLWENIMNNENSKREDIFEIDDYVGFYAMIQGKYKFIMGDGNLEYSPYFGGDLQGLTGPPPSYEDAITNSAVFEIFNKLGFTINIEELINKTNLIVKCEQNHGNECIPGKDKGCLYNIEDDPCEQNDLSNNLPELYEEMKSRLHLESEKRIPREVPLYRDPRGRPRLHNFTWTNWYDSLSEECNG